MSYELRLLSYELSMGDKRERGARIELCHAIDQLTLAGFWLAGEYG